MNNDEQDTKSMCSVLALWRLARVGFLDDETISLLCKRFIEIRDADVFNIAGPLSCLQIS